MPEYPDVELYVEALEETLQGQVLTDIKLLSPFLLRTVEPRLDEFHGQAFLGASRLGKRIVMAFEDDLFLVIHLMIAGRLRWKKADAKGGGKAGLALFRFPHGTLVFTEASTRKRASLHAMRGKETVLESQRDGVELFAIDKDTFATALRAERHTIKRALTDPDIISGVGNAYSDEILHHARMSPFKRTDQLNDEEIERLFASSKKVLTAWKNLLRSKNKGKFPDKVTAFHEEMAVHGKFEQPCPVCETPVQRIRYASNEANYCPQCQTNGKLLADRSLSRLMHDWPKTLEELESRKKK